MIQRIIGFAGQIGAGKTTAARYLEDKYKFKYIRYSRILSEMLQEQNIVITRESLQNFGEEIFQTLGGEGLTKILFERIKDSESSVVDGIRHLSDANTLRSFTNCRFKLLFIECDDSIRKKRFDGNAEAFEKAMKHPVEKEVIELRLRADQIISNNGTREELYSKLERIVEINQWQM